MLGEGIEPAHIGEVCTVSGMVIFALCKHDLAQSAGITDPLDLPVEPHERIVLAKHILGGGLFSGFHKRYAVCHGFRSGTFTQHMNAFFEEADGVGRVLIEVVCQKDSIEVMLEKFFKIGIIAGFVTETLSGSAEPMRIFVAYGYNVSIVEQDGIGIVQTAVCTENTQSDRFQISILSLYMLGCCV